MSRFPVLLKQPQRRIHPSFRDQIRITMRDRISQTQLALMVGIPQQSGLSVLLRMPFPASPLTLKRLEQLATIVGYTGEILAPEQVAQ